ncbi:MAG: PD40 domain-containing protein [Acidobacteriota bacterium]|nr:PD40 domain-containing protein [Acidobacteriota bacterium]
MMRKSALIALMLSGCLGAVLFAQDIKTWISDKGAKPALAVPDFRATGAGQPLMASFNSTLFSDLDKSGCFSLVSKSMYPLNNPQRPEDLRPDDNHLGYALSDWSGSPTQASHLVFGYGAAVNGALAIYGNVYDTRVQSIPSAQLLSAHYAGSLDEAGAIHAAHEFSSDVISKFCPSAGSLLGSRIYFVSDRTGGQEIWAMDWDGNNQKPLTHLRSISIMPNVSPDGSRVAFTTYASGTPRIMMIDSQTGRALNFYNQEASLNANVTFTPDGNHIYFASSAAGLEQIFEADLNGQGFRRVAHHNAIDAEPKVNPKNPNLLLYVSGASGAEQIYQMTAQGADSQRITNGEGEASNPSWNPDGQHIAFSWTRGYARGDWNVFVMDVASREYIQLTHSEGRNENPTWAPDGKHIVFASTRSGKSQIYTMLADGTQVTPLTHQGNNKSPVWGAK